MSEDIVALDGNAAGGLLGRILALDATLARIVCGECAFEGPLAELRLYGRDAGIVLRCRRCDAVNIRMLETRRSINLDFSGAARLTIQLPPASG